MRFLFMLKHPGSVRNFESTLRLLGDREHTVLLCFESLRAGDRALADEICATYPRFKLRRAPKAGFDPLGAFTRNLRATIDYLRFLEPGYEIASALRAQARRAAPTFLCRLLDATASAPRALRIIGAGLRRAERMLPAPPAVERWMRDRQADAVLISPLVALASRQANYGRASRDLRIPTALPVYSWDSLTSKGLIRDAPDLVAVWNQAQADEARELHHVPDDRVTITGAVAYDHWFGWSPSTEREEFLRRVGLPPDRRLILYVGSSPFIGAPETEFVERWLAAIRNSTSGSLRLASVLVRPHPQNAEQWRKWDPGDAAVAVWPRSGADPILAEARAEYYDSIHHAAVVVGLNTSAMFEAGIIGRPVLTPLDPAFTATQEGTLHFRYFSEEVGGPVRVGRSLDEHRAQLADALELRGRTRSVSFLESFVRPYGESVPATPRLVEAIEAVASTPTAGWQGSRLLERVIHGLLKRMTHAGDRRYQRRLRAVRNLPAQAGSFASDASAERVDAA